MSLDLIAAVFGGLAVFVVAWKSFLTRPPPVQRPEPEEMDFILLLVPVLRVLALFTRGLIGRRMHGWAQRKLDAGGMRPYLAVEEFFALRFLLLGVAVALGLFTPDFYGRILIATALVFPELWISSLISMRQKEIRRTLPYFTDLLAMCTGAGLDFGSAIDRVLARTQKGPLAYEFRLARRDTQLGKSQQESLSDMAARVQLPELTSFVAIIVQAIRMGSTVTGILEAQAEKMRIERYEKAERLGTEAQQKILAPLILLILPAFVLLGIVPLTVAMARPILESGFLGGLW